MNNFPMVTNESKGSTMRPRRRNSPGIVPGLTNWRFHYFDKYQRYYEVAPAASDEEFRQAIKRREVFRVLPGKGPYMDVLEFAHFLLMRRQNPCPSRLV